MLPKIGQLWKVKEKFKPAPDLDVPFIITKVRQDKIGAVVCWYQRLDRDYEDNAYGTAIIINCELVSDV